MLTTAAQQQLINYRYSNSTGSRIKSDSKSHTFKNPEKANKSDLDMIYSFLVKLQQEVEKIQNDLAQK